MNQPIRKFQVFVSSTYDDLRSERTAVFFALARQRFIPVGMDLFTANPDRGWQVITRVIDLSDYYILIIGGRYGSIDSSTGKSWTEREYDYATSKGLRPLVFVSAENRLTDSLRDSGTDAGMKRQLLDRLVVKVHSAHLCEPWDDASDLAHRVMQALSNLIDDDDIDGTLPPGWIRGPGVFAVASELAALSQENRALRVLHGAGPPPAISSWQNGLAPAALGGFLGGFAVVLTMTAFVLLLPYDFHQLNVNQVLTYPIFGAPITGAVGAVCLYSFSVWVHSVRGVATRAVITSLGFLLGGGQLVIAHVITTRNSPGADQNLEWLALSLFGGASCAAIANLIDARRFMLLSDSWRASVLASLIGAVAYGSVVMLGNSAAWFSNRGLLTTAACFLYLQTILGVIWSARRRMAR